GGVEVRKGEGWRRGGPRPGLVPLINGADRGLRWFIQDVWGLFGTDHTRPGAPLFPSEREGADGSCSRATAEVFRRSLAEAAERHLPAWAGRLTRNALRHFALPGSTWRGMSLFAIQELLGHAWTGTTARYIHVHGTRVFCYSFVERGHASARPHGYRAISHSLFRLPATCRDRRHSPGVVHHQEGLARPADQPGNRRAGAVLSVPGEDGDSHAPGRLRRAARTGWPGRHLPRVGTLGGGDPALLLWLRQRESLSQQPHRVVARRPYPADFKVTHRAFAQFGPRGELFLR